MDKISCTLLVDDDQTSNFVNSLLLKKLDITDSVFVAPNGQKALEVLQQQCADGCCPQLILLDINMPVMDGFAFLEAYKELSFKEKPSVVIVVLTTSLHPRDLNRLHEMPIDEFMNKPLTKDKVRNLLHKHFDLHLPE